MSTPTPLTRGRVEPPDRAGLSRLRPGAGRRSVPHLVLGILLVTGCLTGAVLWSITTGERRPALALARAVTIGQTLAAADLREVNVALDGEVDAVAASEAGSVIGRRVAVTMPAGALLPRGALGAPTLPATGDAVAALALQAGQVPPDVAAGAHVLIVLTADPNNSANPPSGTSSPDSTWPAVVTGVTSVATDHALVVSALLREDDARRVAAAPPGRLSIVLVAGNGRR